MSLKIYSLQSNVFRYSIVFQISKGIYLTLSDDVVISVSRSEKGILITIWSVPSLDALSMSYKLFVFYLCMICLYPKECSEFQLGSVCCGSG